MAGFFAASLPEILGTTAAEDAAATAAIPLLDTSVVDAGGVLAGIGLGDAGATAATSGILGAVPEAAATDAVGAAVPATAPDFSAAANAQAAQAAQAAGNAVPGEAAMQGANATVGSGLNPVAPVAPSFDGTSSIGQSLGSIADPVKQGFSDAFDILGKGSDWVEKHKTSTMLGLMGASKLLGPSYAQPVVQKPTGRAMNMTLANNFAPSRSYSDTSVYNPSYGVPTAAQGGVMSYDQGGIAAMANGGSNPGVGSQGMGNPQSYPGARLDMTQYATPSQMPTSSSVINSGYEMQTNPYTGEPNGMAEGGIASFAGGGFAVNQATQNNTMPSAGTTNNSAQTYHPSFNDFHNSMNGMPGGGNMGYNNMYGYSNPYGMNGMNGMGYNSNYSQNGLFGGLFGGQNNNPGVSPNFHPAPSVTPQVYQPQYAAGGILAFKSGSTTTAPDDSHISYLSAESPWKTNQDTDVNTALASAQDAAAYRQKKLENLVGFANRAKLAPQMALGQVNHIPAAQQAQLAAMQAQAAAQPQAAQGAPVQEAASGGIMGYSLGGYATGGNPRLLKGPGDGMSDNIPAVIADKQPARLADGEFVVPADVVSHLGNGSTDAGAKKLHTMMDTVRKARTGSKKQGKQIDPNKFLPA